jgi:hypothetical protein
MLRTDAHSRMEQADLHAYKKRILQSSQWEKRSTLPQPWTAHI